MTTFKAYWGDSITDKVCFGDKAYSDFEYFNSEKREVQDIEMLTPVKAIKGQPIESFFNWLIEKTNIQRAVKVRATKGLLVHIMGKMAIAFTEITIAFALERKINL